MTAYQAAKIIIERYPKELGEPKNSTDKCVMVAVAYLEFLDSIQYRSCECGHEAREILNNEGKING